MRYHEKPPKKVRTLGQLIRYIFNNESWFKKEVERNYKKPQTAQEFDGFVKATIQLRAPANNVLLLWVTRNYSIHISDVETPYFFDNFVEVFQSIVGFYLFYPERFYDLLPEKVTSPAQRTRILFPHSRALVTEFRLKIRGHTLGFWKALQHISYR